MNKNIIRIATCNVGDFSGKNIKSGSEESRRLYRELFKKVGAGMQRRRNTA